jgi:hypothetical protein
MQVGMMDRIYQAAARVDIWLGKADESSQRLSQLIHSLVELLPEEQKWFPVNTTAPRFTLAELDDNDALRTLGLPARTEAIWDDLISFLKRRWFKRVWVLQEVALKKEAMVLWGSRPSKVVHQYNIYIYILIRRRPAGLGTSTGLF